MLVYQRVVPLSEQSKHYPAKNTCVRSGDMFKVKTSMAKVGKVHYSIILDFIRFHQISSDFMFPHVNDETWWTMIKYDEIFRKIWMDGMEKSQGAAFHGLPSFLEFSLCSQVLRCFASPQQKVVASVSTLARSPFHFSYRHLLLA